MKQVLSKAEAARYREVWEHVTGQPLTSEAERAVFTAELISLLARVKTRQLACDHEPLEASMQAVVRVPGQSRRETVPLSPAAPPRP